MILIKHPDPAPDAELGLRMAESRATATYAFAFALCSATLLPLGWIHDQHLLASRQVPIEANGYPSPELDAWRRSHMRVRLLTCPATLCAVSRILLDAEDHWLRSLHRWIMTCTRGSDRASLSQSLLNRQWHNRNLVLECSQKARATTTRGDRPPLPPSRIH